MAVDATVRGAVSSRPSDDADPGGGTRLVEITRGRSGSRPHHELAESPHDDLAPPALESGIAGWEHVRRMKCGDDSPVSALPDRLHASEKLGDRDRVSDVH